MLPLALAGVAALGLAAVQLAPTLELTGLSRRQGGLPVNEVVSFSLHPLLLARALLPGYGQAPYIEYTAFLPLTALALALAGAWGWRRDRRVAAALLLALTGLFLALGRANPLYPLLLARLPGFNLFRVPARWLVLTALGAALLAGVGWEQWERRSQRVRAVAVLGVAALVPLAFLSAWLARFVPLPPESPAEWPSRLTALGWGVELVLLGGALWGARRASAPPYSAPLRAAWLPLATLVLFLATRTLAAHSLTAPEAYDGLRPAVARLIAATAPARAAGLPPGRYLSMSQGFFDPGDMTDLATAYADQLTPAQWELLVVTLKDREILVPNLALPAGLAAVDGFDGGLLPTADYVAVADLLLPDGVDTVDGRLRESIRSVPDARWLDLFNVRYLITDKVGDQWFAADGMQAFFDLQHPLTLAPGASAAVGYLPPYAGTELWLVADGAPGTVTATVDSHSQQGTPQQLGDRLYRVVWDRPGTVTALTLTAGAQPWQVAGLALVDARDGTFRALVPGAYRLWHSGDVKVYENLDVLPRAFAVARWEAAPDTAAPDTAAAVARLRDPAFDPRVQAVVVTDGPLPPPPTAPPPAQVTVHRYAPERVVVGVDSAESVLLILTDAHYPGWRAAVDGVPTPIVKVNGLFRGVFVPPGAVEVTFELGAQRVAVGAIITATTAAVLLGAAVAGRRRADAD